MHFSSTNIYRKNMPVFSLEGDLPEIIELEREESTQIGSEFEQISTQPKCQESNAPRVLFSRPKQSSGFFK